MSATSITALIAMAAAVGSSAIMNDSPLSWADASPLTMVSSSTQDDEGDDEQVQPEYLVIYDMRDIAAALPHEYERQNIGEALLEQFVSTGSFGSVYFQPLLDGVFYMTGTAADIDLLNTQIEKVRSMYTQRYEIELVCYNLPENQPCPPLGDSAVPVEPFVRVRQTVIRRATTALECTRTQYYVSDWQPVVGDQSVGYDPQLETVDDGLTTSVIVGAAQDDDNGRTLFCLDGVLSLADIASVPGPSVTGTTRSLELGLPVIESRSLHVNLPLAPDQMTAIAVVDGFSGESPIVIAAKLRALP